LSAAGSAGGGYIAIIKAVDAFGKPDDLPKP
jgi:hypothetical protein